MNYWLIKSEPGCYSIDDLAKDKKAEWTGIRNYQARNFMRDSMKIGDLALLYHSGGNAKEVVGVVRVSSAPHPDVTALDLKDDHFDPKATKDNPIWICVDVAFVKKYTKSVSLAQIKFDPRLKGIMVASVGSRLSIQPVSGRHFRRIEELAG